MPYGGPIGSDFWRVPNPESGRHYRWLSLKPERLSVWLRGFGKVPGYRLERGRTLEETRALCERLGYPTECVNEATNRIEQGMNVLASIPEAENLRRRTELLSLYGERLSAAKDKAQESVESIPHVRFFEDHPDQIEDKKRFHQRADRPVSGQTGIGDSPVFRGRSAGTPG